MRPADMTTKCQNEDSLFTVCMSTVHPQALQTPKPRNPQKVSHPECQKSVTSPRTTDFETFLALLRVLWDLFDTFLTLRAARPRWTLLRLFGDFGPKGPRDSCIGVPADSTKIYYRTSHFGGALGQVIYIYICWRVSFGTTF